MGSGRVFNLTSHVSARNGSHPSASGASSSGDQHRRARIVHRREVALGPQEVWLRRARKADRGRRERLLGRSVRAVARLGGRERGSTRQVAPGVLPSSSFHEYTVFQRALFHARHSLAQHAVNTDPRINHLSSKNLLHACPGG